MEEITSTARARFYAKYIVTASLMLVALQISKPVCCNPLAFNPNPLPIIALPSAAYHPAYQSSATPMMIAGQYDPYASVSAPYFMPAPLIGGPWGHFDADRRSLPGMFGSAGLKNNRGTKEQAKHQEEPTDEQKALEGLPLSLIEPDPPATITERLSESFSALGEGFRNHFRSLSENFSDTMDDIKDAWRPSSSNNDNSRKRRS